MSNNLARVHAVEGGETAGGRIPPQALEAEESVLGGVLLDNEAINRVEFLGPEDFYREKHRRIFAAMQDLSNRNEPVDLVTLSAELRKRGELESVDGEAYLAHLASRVPTAANIVYYGHLVQEKSLLRALIGASTEIAGSAYEPNAAVEELLDKAEAAILQVSENRMREPFHHIKVVVRDAFRHIEKLQDTHQDITGVPSGFADIDHLLSGLQPTDLIVLAARPSMGKTSLALNIAQNAAVKHHMPVAIFSLEMGKEQLAMRMLCSEARIDSAQMRRGFLNDDAMRRLIDAAGSLSDAPIYIDDTAAITPLELKAKARRIKKNCKEAPLGLVVVDYLQLMQAPRSNENRAQEVAEISRALKALAKELGWPVMALSQLNRGVESRVDKRPMLSDLRESGAIEQDADVVAFIFREEHYEPEKVDVQGKAELIIAKNRNGPTKTIPLAFLKQFTAFADYTPMNIPYEDGGGDPGPAGGGFENDGGFDPGGFEGPPAF